MVSANHLNVPQASFPMSSVVAAARLSSAFMLSFRFASFFARKTLAMETYLRSIVNIEGQPAAVKDIGDVFESRMQWLYSQHKLLDAIDVERLERLHIWDEETSSWELVQQASSSLAGLVSAEKRGEARKVQYAKHVMQDYYERILDGEAVRNEILEKHKALSKAKMAVLLGEE